MGSADSTRRLVVNADDFGRSSSINEAVIRAHTEGILTTASLMVNGDAVDEAVALARKNPRLGIGLHLTLVCGRPTLPAREIPGLATDARGFSDNAVASGMKYFFRGALASEIEREMAAQFRKFKATGLVMDHVNGHLNFHLHPTVFRLLMRNAGEWGIRAMRLTRDRLGSSLQIARGRLGYRFSHAVIFGVLSRWARPRLVRHRIRHTETVFGLLETGQVTEDYLLALIPRFPEGDSELYSHPCTEKFREELEALISLKVARLLESNGIQLIRYQDL